MQKREREKDNTDMNLLETAHMISKYPLKLPVIERAGTLTGNNATNGVGPLPICSKPDEALRTTWKIKKDIMGDRIRRVGGSGGEAGEVPAERRKPDDVEAVFFHNMSSEWYADLVASGCYKGTIDLTPVDGGLSYACIVKGIPCSSTWSHASSMP